MALIILRVLLIIVASGIGVTLINSNAIESAAWAKWAAFLGCLTLAFVVIGIDLAVRRKQLQTITAVYFGLIIGMFLTYILRLALHPLLITLGPDQINGVQLILAMLLCYICISVLLQTQSDFRFIIPYVEFAREVKGRKPYVLDTSVVIDGRIADVVDTQILDSQLVMPRFVIAELQAIADSSDRMRRSRGRRGLDILNRLRSNDKVDLEIFDRDLPEFEGNPVDLKLVLLAKHLDGKIITNDYNLNKVAQVQGVGVLNLNDLANALKPVFLPGETIEVRIVKPGESHGQGVGYLEDGTMIVIEGGRDYINRDVRVAVTSVLQTSAGRMVFAKIENAGTQSTGKA